MPAPHACLPPPRRRSSAPLVLAMLLALAQGSWEARRGAAGSQRAGGVFIDKQQGWGGGGGWGEQARERVYARHDNTTTATRCWGQVASFLGKLGEVARKGVGGVRGDGDGREEEGKRSEAQKKREHMLQLLFEFTKRPQETGSPLRSVGRCLLCMRTVIVEGSTPPVGRARNASAARGVNILTAEEAITIFVARKERWGRRDQVARNLACRFGVAKRTVQDIWNLRTWADTTRPLWSSADFASTWRCSAAAREAHKHGAPQTPEFAPMPAPAPGGRVQKGSRLSPGSALKWTACIKVRVHGVARGTILVARRAWAHAC